MSKREPFAHERPFVSVGEAGMMLGVSDDTIRRMVRQNTLSAVKLGNRWWIRRQSIAEYRARPNGAGLDWR